MGEGIKSFDCAGHTTREINTFLKSVASSSPESAAALVHPDSRHNLAVGITQPISITIDGNVGYYCAGLCDGVDITINGDAGWGLAENLMSGSVILEGSAGSAACATVRGGFVAIKGDSGARCGIAMKGGTVVVGGSVGTMSAFMMQKGVLIIAGDAGPGLGDSLYEGKIYIAGTVESLGSDAVEVEMTEDDIILVADALFKAGIDKDAATFRKIQSGKKLYNFNTKEKEIWKTAL
jgi:glutamate synthase domain-containing protein 3